MESYARGAENGASVDWSDVDHAHTVAQEALRILDTSGDELLSVTAGGQSSEPYLPRRADVNRYSSVMGREGQPILLRSLDKAKTSR